MKQGHEFNRRSIKYYVRNYLLANKQLFSGKKVIDLPAGNGVTSKILVEIGAEPLPFDLFPEYFQVQGLECRRVNVMQPLPLDDGCADALICQEGMEHFPDQLSVLRHFNRVLKTQGILLITTPNYSNLSSRLSYLLTESERYNSIMPPNEVDSIWMSDQSLSDEIYYGHIFLTGIQKLRVLAVLAGFKIKRIIPTRIKSTSLILMFLFYPFVLFFNTMIYYKNLLKKRAPGRHIAETYREVFRYSIRPRILIDSHLIVEFEKYAECNEVNTMLKSRHTTFGTT
jgi:SAM-dependent methyltransferase